jgi:hypothetical protein
MENTNDATIMGYKATLDAASRILASGMTGYLVEGSPGTAKTSMRFDLAERLGLEHIFMLKMAHHDVVDIAGVPVPNETTKRTHFYASGDMLPPDDGKPYLVVLDEFGDCAEPQQNLGCQMVLELRTHNYEFHPDTKFLLTSNRIHDKSGARRIVTKLLNRVARSTLIPHIDEVFNYGATKGWNPISLAFLKMHGAERVNPSDTRADAPTYFMSFDPKDATSAAMQFASPRSHEAASNYLNYIDQYAPELAYGTQVAELAAIVGTPVAYKMAAFRKIAVTMPDPEKILNGIKVPSIKATEVLWSLTLTLASRVKKAQVKHMAAFLDANVPDEFFILAARICFDTRLNELASPDFNAMINSPKLKAAFSTK